MQCLSCLLGKQEIAGSKSILAFEFQKNNKKKKSAYSYIFTINRGDPPGARGSVLGLRPPGLEFRIMFLKGSVITFISPSSEGSSGPV